MESRESLINQIALLHEEKEHQKIIALIEGQPPAAMDYELTSLLARAYINYAQPYMDSFQEHIKHAVELLRSVEAEGMADRSGTTASALPSTGRTRKKAP